MIIPYKIFSLMSLRLVFNLPRIANQASSSTLSRDKLHQIFLKICCDSKCLPLMLATNSTNDLVEKALEYWYFHFFFL